LLADCSDEIYGNATEGGGCQLSGHTAGIPATDVEVIAIVFTVDT